jgi:ABC-type bacteriocin/lantibiotic exporter with double-glycine peptidase domain
VNLTNQEQSPRPSQASILLRCATYLKPYWKTVTGVYVTMVLIDVIAMINPQLIRWTIDKGIGKSDDLSLALAVGGLLLLVLVKGLISRDYGQR